MIPQWARRWQVPVTVALLLTWAVAAHLGSSGDGNANLNAAVAVTPLLAAWTVLLWQWHSRWVLAAGLAGAALLVFELW